ncbi:protein phosphatase 2C domain-containing protein [Candidatus Igneacidithiobacillus taiwanensis]|uniref:PP2C family protein-serine/threonine phosphatase n=1 Tax=Candidatus Igneacidithiobacillus taiwanensis TaxID=1945924 RepID=UPI00289F075E|nr:protein phosphatase 2C domain-containing protein [Candidatus Igneacidithiobacillus taiwanensis]
MIHIAAFSRRGVGKPHNEDALCVAGQLLQGSVSEQWQIARTTPLLVAVADGVAVGTTPRRASRALINLLLEADIAHKPAYLATQLRAIQARYASLADTDPTAAGMASTLVGAVIHGQHCTVFNVGDARAYVRDIAGGMRQISHDHTQIQDMLDAGEVTAEQARHAASIYDQLTGYFLAEAEFEEFRVHVAQCALQQGERLILASDGLHEALSDAEIGVLFVSCSLEVLHHAFRRARQRGGTDDFTVLCVASEMRQTL